MSGTKEKYAVFAAFWMALALNTAVWWHSHTMQPRWGNVPPAPSAESASLMTLGDKQFAYRSFALFLQNLGDAGGQARALKEYDYNHLSQWLWLEDKLDPVSNFIPALAGYYFSAAQDPKMLDPIIDYLEEIGSRSGPQKWRWLGQAVYLARFVQHDYDKAMRLAEKLAALDYPDMPTWTDQMPAFVSLQQGNREAAYQLMLNVLQSDRTLQAAEINSMRAYICDRVLTKEQKAADELCKAPY